jgi:hypothetical protein
MRAEQLSDSKSGRGGTIAVRLPKLSASWLHALDRARGNRVFGDLLPRSEAERDNNP